MLFSGGVITTRDGETAFTRTKGPSHSDLEIVVHTKSQRIADYVEKTDLIQCDIDNTFSIYPWMMKTAYFTYK